MARADDGRGCMYVDLYRDQEQLFHHDDPSPVAVLNWIHALDSSHVTDVVIASPTVQLNLSVRGQEINLSFSGENISEHRNVTVPRATAIDMALYFLKNKGLPQ